MIIYNFIYDRIGSRFFFIRCIFPFLFIFFLCHELFFRSFTLPSTLLRFTKRFVCASPFTEEYIDRSSERPGREFGSGGPERFSPPLSIESQSRDRSPRSTIQILGHRNSFSALLRRCLLRRTEEKKQKIEIEKEENCCLLLNIHKDSPFLFQYFYFSLCLSLSL